MARQGEIPAFKVRGQWPFRRRYIDGWIDRQQNAGAGEEST